MEIYIIDIIGSHSGTSFYNRSFREVLKTKYEKVGIVSNYVDPESDTVAVFENYYEGHKLTKIFRLLKSLLNFYHFIFKNRKAGYIFQSFGNAYEILFIWPLVFTGRAIVDIHEVISLIDKKPFQNIVRRLCFSFAYKRMINAVIVHSERTEELLDKIKFRKVRLYIPHFSYKLNMDFEEDAISDEIKRLISLGKVNILFFGFMRITKGVDIVISVARLAQSSQISDKMNFIVAGKDPDNILIPLIQESGKEGLDNVSSRLCHITDNELKFLFSFSDIVFLPYRQISQSGVLEMAIQFRKPVVTSSLKYFTQILDLFPSFGFYSKSENPEEFLNIFKTYFAQADSDRHVFYSDSDLRKFEEYKNAGKFLSELNKILPSVDIK